MLGEHMSQVNIKPVYYCGIPVTPTMGRQTQRHKTPGWSTTTLITKGVVKRRKTSLPNAYHTMQIRKPNLASYLLEQSKNLSAF